MKGELHSSKRIAENAITNRQYEVALEYYTQMLNKWHIIVTQHPQMINEIPKLLTNRSYTFARMGRYDLALEDADICTKQYPYWRKVYSCCRLF